MISLRRWTTTLAFALAAGCYDAAAREDAGADAAFSGDANVDLAACTTATGAVRCNTPECPISLCSSCYPFWDEPERPTPAYCMRGADLLPLGGLRSCDRLSFYQCDPDNLCAVGRPPRHDTNDTGECATAPVCAQYVAEDNPYYQCIYGDGTAFRTGEVPRTPCPASVRGLACGQGCARCGEGEVCFGASEQSGVGLCLPATPWGGPDSRACGEGVDRSWACEPGEACVRFVVSAPISDRLGMCVPPATCAALAEAMPERFACVE
ncbi:MAG: hypothetical protein OHK0013_24580 [Sandaracinaceae bacterium]